ncbi:MAG: tRNA pseudouridine(38-40) synthase TruA [bacterium]
MRNIKLIVQYDGSGFSGFEIQPRQRTVRFELEKALFKLFKQRAKLISSSRTDSGVHALHSVVNFKIDSSIPTKSLAAALNGLLSEDIRVIKAEAKGQRQKAKGFHARYDAKSKEYEYLIFNGQILPPHLRKIVWHVKPKLDLAKMKKAAKFLVGRHDFKEFCAAKSGKTNFVRTIYKISIRKKKIKIWDRGDVPVVSCVVNGDGFLYKMVRNIVGRLVEVGLGKQKPARRCAPGQGLCLLSVEY